MSDHRTITINPAGAGRYDALRENYDKTVAAVSEAATGRIAARTLAKYPTARTLVAHRDTSEDGWPIMRAERVLDAAGNPIAGWHDATELWEEYTEAEEIDDLLDFLIQIDPSYDEGPVAVHLEIDPTAGPRTYRLRRHSDVDLVFDGELLAEVSSRRPDSNRWSEIRIYRASDGRFVVEETGPFADRPAPRATVTIAADTDGIRKALMRKGKPSDPALGRNGEEVEYLPAIALDALAAAAAADPSLDMAETL